MPHGSIDKDKTSLTTEPKVIIFDYGRTLYDRDNEEFFPEVPDVLQYLSASYRLSIVSIAKEGNPPEARVKALEEAGIKDYFFPILFHENSKDDLLERVLRDTDTGPGEVVVVDDRVRRSIAWGNKRGAITIWLRKGKFADELPDENTGMPTYVIESLSALKELL